ncbi:MAG: hypothetical protein ABI560_03750 [Myxococcales bacterium]
MPRTNRKSSFLKSSLLSVALALGASALLVGQLGHVPAARAAGAVPSMSAPELAQGPYAAMHMLLQKTFLKINVLDLDVRLDRAAQSKLSAVAQGRAYSDGLAPQLGQAVMGAGHALIQMEFKRDVPLKRWIGVVRDNLEEARKANLITLPVEKRIGDGLPEWFAALKDRGYQKGDRLFYQVSPDALRTVVTSAAGQILLERLDRDKDARNVVLATYFAPGSEFREPLLRSLFQGRN